MLSSYQSQRVHYDKKKKSLMAIRNSSINALISKCEAIVRSYDVAIEQRAKDALLSNASKKHKKNLSTSIAVVDKEGFVTVTHKRGRSVAAALDSAPNISFNKYNDCLFSFYNPNNIQASEASSETNKSPTLIPNFYRSDKRVKKIEGN